MVADEKVLEFWNKRADLGKTAGTNDFVLTELEQRFIVDNVPANSRIIDIGCGNGDSLIRLVKEKGVHGVGIDFSEKMIETAQKAIDDHGLTDKIQLFQRVLPPVPNEWGQFDLAYSQRCLINLKTTEEQRIAAMSVQNLLKPGGIYIMMECNLDGGERTNEIRCSLDLEPIDPPWHNLFFREAEVASWSTDEFKLEAVYPISSTYHFLSRVVYARLAADKNEELKYDSDINLLALKLPPMIGNFGPVNAWIWRKKA